MSIRFCYQLTEEHDTKIISEVSKYNFTAMEAPEGFKVYNSEGQFETTLKWSDYCIIVFDENKYKVYNIPRPVGEVIFNLGLGV